MSSRTPYVETEFLLAVMEENEEEIDRLVSDMLPGERKRLYRQLSQAQDALDAREI